MTLNIVGSASAKPTVSRNPSAQAIDVQGHLFLIDCGEGTQMRLLQMGLSLLKIEAVFISHPHGDHLFGLFGLLSTMEMLGRTKKLTVFGAEMVGEAVDFFLSHFTDGDVYEIEYVPLTMTAPELIYDGGTVDVWAFPLMHRVPAFGFLFREKERGLNIYKDAVAKYGLSVEEILALKSGQDVVRSVEPAVDITENGQGGTMDAGGCAEGQMGAVSVDGSAEGQSGTMTVAVKSGRQEGMIIRASEVTYRPPRPKSYAYCSDTAPFPELAEWVRGVDLLYHEATFPKDMTEKAALTFHSTTVQAAECAKKAGVGKLLVGHFSSRFPDFSFYLDEIRPIFPNAALANDGDIIEI